VAVLAVVALGLLGTGCSAGAVVLIGVIGTPAGA